MELDTSGLGITPATAAGKIAPTVRPTRPAASARQDRDWTLPGLCWNASVMTSFGALPVQVLRLHDPLRLSDGQVARIAWIDKIQLDEGFLSAYPDAQPVLIRAGALGAGMPTQDILVSPNQKILVRGADYNSVPRLARDLLGRPGILRQPQARGTYYMFHRGQTASVVVDWLMLYTRP